MWGISRPSSPGHSPVVSPTQRHRPPGEACSPRSNSPPHPSRTGTTPASTPGQLPAQHQPQAQASRTPATRAPQPVHPPVVAPQQARPPPPQPRETAPAAAAPAVAKPGGAASPPLRSPARSSSLAAVLKVPAKPAVPKRLWVHAPGLPMAEGKYLQSAERVGEWVNPELGNVQYTDGRWCVMLYPTQLSLSSLPVVDRAGSIDASPVRSPSQMSNTGPTTLALRSDLCPSTVLPHRASGWTIALSGVRDSSCDVRDHPGKYFFWDQEITGIGDAQDFETALEAGVGELEEHIYISHKLAYIDNVGNMYRLPRSNPAGTPPGSTSTSASQPTGQQQPSPTLSSAVDAANTKIFNIGEFLRYLYAPEGLGWVDGRPAVLAAMIYVDRIRARGRIVSRRSVHRLLAAAVLVGHEVFTKIMHDAGESNVEPAPIAGMCEMVYLTVEQMEPLVARFRGMLDLELKVLETDVTAYCGALCGGVEMTQELRDEAKKERVPGQQGLSSRRDGMDLIRQWIDDAMVSCHRNLQAPAESSTRSSGLSKRRSLVQYRLGGSASRVAVVVLQKVKNSGGSRLYVALTHVTPRTPPHLTPVHTHRASTSPSHQHSTSPLPPLTAT